MQSKTIIRKTIKKAVQDDTKDDISDAQEARGRRTSGTLVTVLVFVVAYALFIFNFEHLGLALGWLPSGMIAAALGWVAYCFPWIGDVVAILLELLAAFAG